MKRKLYKVENVCGQAVDILITLENGVVIEDTLEVGETCYGVSDHAYLMLREYELLGLIRIEESGETGEDFRWLKEGF